MTFNILLLSALMNVSNIIAIVLNLKQSCNRSSKILAYLLMKSLMQCLALTSKPHTDRTEENFPFIKWLEEKDGLLFLNESYRDDLYKYWHEKQANGEDLKRLLWAIMQGAGLLYEENKHLLHSLHRRLSNPHSGLKISQC